GDPGPGDKKAGEADDDDKNTTATTNTTRRTFRNFFAFSRHAAPQNLPAAPALRSPEYRGIRWMSIVGVGELSGGDADRGARRVRPRRSGCRAGGRCPLRGDAERITDSQVPSGVGPPTTVNARR